MSTLTYRISPEIFEKYPGYARGVVLAFGVHNGRSPAELVSMLRAVEEKVRRDNSFESIAEHPRIKPWREAYKAFGAKPSEYRSSIEAMARRALHGDQLPEINTLVDIGTIVSLQHLLPVGGHSMDELSHDISLCFASGDENFIPFGGTEVEHPQPGEVIFAEGQTGLTRRWTWRQGNHTLTVPETQSIEINIDRLPPIELEEIHSIANQVMALVEQFCGGQTRYEILDSSNPQMSLSPA